ncbi:MAG: hypothetical protein WC621_01440 [Patescibacteria group bacterium]
MFHLEKLNNIKVVLINIVIIIIFVIVPYSISSVYNRQHYNDFAYTLQYISSLFSVVGGYLLINYNNKVIKVNFVVKKWLPISFKILGSAICILNVLLIFIFYAFRNCCGF